MGFTLPPPPMNPADQVRSLSIRKQGIEAELEAQLAILTANSSTLSSPLVDPEGFPRSDIDVFAVRGARVRIIELRNDLKAVMDEIGKALELVYDPRSLAPAPGSSQTSAEKSTSDGPMWPFAKVDDVAPNGPAGIAGLQRDDFILRFGHLTRQSFSSSSLSPVADLVSASENRSVPITILRGSQTMVLNLTPKTGWGGRGMLGCHIVPYSAS